MINCYTFTDDALEQITDCIDAVRDHVDDFNDVLGECTEDQDSYAIRPDTSINPDRYHSSDTVYENYLSACAACREQLACLQKDMQHYVDDEMVKLKQHCLAYNDKLFSLAHNFPAELRNIYNSCIEEYCTDRSAASYLKDAFDELSLPLNQMQSLCADKMYDRLVNKNFQRLTFLDICKLYPYCSIDSEEDRQYYFDLSDAFEELIYDVSENLIDTASDFDDLFYQDTMEYVEPILETLQLQLEDIASNAEDMVEE